MTNQTFLENSDHTGRFIVVANNGKRYFVEPIGNPHTNFGDVNPATKRVEGSYGAKFKGSIDGNESLITPENGFKNIVTLGVGVSPLDYINSL